MQENAGQEYLLGFWCRYQVISCLYRCRIVLTVLLFCLFAWFPAMSMHSTNNSLQTAPLHQMDGKESGSHAGMPLHSGSLNPTLKFLLEKEFCWPLWLWSPEQWKLRWPPNDQVNLLHQVSLWPRLQTHWFLLQIWSAPVLGCSVMVEQLGKQLLSWRSCTVTAR